jgi:NDP-sugar pyrophosphorylase family protein
MVMRYKICSSFPLYDLINFHKEKEYMMRDAAQQDEEKDRNLALVTVAASRVETESASKNYICLAMDESTKEMVHYTENAHVKLSNLVSAGIYFFSVRLFAEYGLSTFSDDNLQPAEEETASNLMTGGCSTPKE